MFFREDNQRLVRAISLLTQTTRKGKDEGSTANRIRAFLRVIEKNKEIDYPKYLFYDKSYTALETGYTVRSGLLKNEIKMCFL